MTLHPLMIDDDARAQVAGVISYAMDHPYRPGGGSIPGDDPGHVAMLDTYRCVFTFTHVGGRVLRHLTISLPVPGKFANPIAAFMIAELFGFTGYDRAEPFKPAPDWLLDVKSDENCVMVAQEL